MTLRSIAFGHEPSKWTGSCPLRGLVAIITPDLVVGLQQQAIHRKDEA